LLISEPARGTPSIILQALKQRVSRDLRGKMRRPSPGQLSLAFPDGDKSLPHFWQPRFHDFNVHSAGKRREKLDYMHANPVKRKLVKNPLAWMWSSASYYATGVPGPVNRSCPVKTWNAQARPTRNTDAWGTHRVVLGSLAVQTGHIPGRLDRGHSKEKADPSVAGRPRKGARIVRGAEPSGKPSGPRGEERR